MDIGSQTCRCTISMSSARFGCWAGWYGMTFCLPCRILSCLVADGSTGHLLKSACNCFLGGTVSSVFKVGMGDSSGSVEGACSLGRIGVGGI